MILCVKTGDGMVLGGCEMGDVGIVRVTDRPVVFWGVENRVV